MRSLRLNVAINVDDFDAVVTFYRDVLGCHVETSWSGEEGPGMIFAVGPGQTVEFFGPPYGARKDKTAARGVELAFEVEDVEGWLEHVRSAGVPIARGLVKNPWGDRSFGIDDPAGMRIWILQKI